MDLFLNAVIITLAIGAGLGLLVLLGFTLFLLLALAVAGPKGFAQKYREVGAKREAEKVLAGLKAAAEKTALTTPRAPGDPRLN